MVLLMKNLNTFLISGRRINEWLLLSNQTMCIYIPIIISSIWSIDYYHAIYYSQDISNLLVIVSRSPNHLLA